MFDSLISHSFRLLTSADAFQCLNDAKEHFPSMNLILATARVTS